MGLVPRTAAPCLSGYKDDGTGTGTCVDADAKLLADLASCHSTALPDLVAKVTSC